MNTGADIAMRVVEDMRDIVAGAAAWPGRGSLNDMSVDGVCARAALAAGLRARLAGVDRASLGGTIGHTLALVDARIAAWENAADWYWTVFDPAGGEMFAMFAPTPYCLGFLASGLAAALQRAPVANEGDQARYLAGLHDFGHALDQMADRTRGQIERGIFMPRAQAEAAVTLLERLERDQAAALAIGEGRLAGAAAFKSDVARVAADRITGGFARLRALLDPAYFAQVRDNVGMMHYPDGPDIYAALVRLHGATDLTPRQVHQVGLDRMAEVRSAMAEARRAAGFAGDDHAYRAVLDADPAWRAETPEAIAAVFQRYIDRFAPEVEKLFRVKPRADYGVRPLPDALTGALTFGYYAPPTPDHPRGDYVFNAHNLAASGLHNLGALTYHELVPGHHLHLALQEENAALSSIRRFMMPTAYVEGWAEYAVTLAEERGMFTDPAERFGRLVSEAFLVCRLVVDTGMNALGWSLEQARAYMRENSFFGEAEIRSETLRYSSDIPGQALAYKLGDRAILAMRERMRAALGDRFDIRDFHDGVLAPGAIPLPALADHIEALTRARLEETGR
jgi:uncharacterized protein (DUF885 family)